MESDGMVGRHEEEYGSEFDNYEEPDDEYDEDEETTYTEAEGGDGFDFESRPPPGIESFEEEETTEEEESNESESEYGDDFNDPFDEEEDDLDF